MIRPVISKHFLFSVALLLALQMPLSLSAQDTDSLVLKLAGTKEDTSRVNLLLKLVSVYRNSDPQKTELYLSRALALSEEKNFDKGIAYSNFYFAVLFRKFDLMLSEQFIEKALEKALKINDKNLLAQVYNYYGLTLGDQGKYEESSRFFTKALVSAISSPNKYDSLCARYTQNIGTNFAKQNKYTLARQCFNNAIAIAGQSGSQELLVTPYNNIGLTYLRENNLELGYKYYMMSLNLALKHDYKRFLPVIYNNLSDFFLRTKDTVKAIEYSKKAVEVAQVTMNRMEKIKALDFLYVIYKSQGNLQKTVEYLEQYKALEDTISSNNQKSKFNLMEARFKYQTELNAGELKMEKQRIVLIFIFVLFILSIILILILFYYQKSKNRQKQDMVEMLQQKNVILEQQITIKAKELTNNILLLSNKNELLTSVIAQLKQIELHTTGEVNRQTHSLITDLQFNISNNIWDIFEKEFLEVHPGFFDKLNNRFPDLTQKDKRLCSLISLNLNTKEISEITHLNIDTVEKARTRLRRKFNLTNTETTLSVFLSQF
jgi:tetratricopeptide (TPR) repeat protein